MEKWLLPPVPIEVLENGAVRALSDPGEPGYEDKGSPRRVSITPQEAGILSLLALDKRVLEIGTGLGVSTRAMSTHALCVFTFDTDPWVQQFIHPSLPSNVMPNPMPEWIRSVDLVFIDGLHTRAALTKDIEVAKRFAVPGKTLVLFHDVQMEIVRQTIVDVLKSEVIPLWEDSNLGWAFL